MNIVVDPDVSCDDLPSSSMPETKPGATPETVEAMLKLISKPHRRPARPAPGVPRWPVGAASHQRGQPKAVHGSGVAG
jgi:hypothetical protein